MRDYVSFYLNGEKKTVSGEAVFGTLSSFLRYEQRLTGTKVVCAEGDCGACTVMVAKWQPEKNQTEYVSINSCIALVFSMDGANIVTVEGLSQQGNLCEVQNSMIRNFGGQCGFCTPGFVMSISNLYEKKSNGHLKDQLSEQSVKNHLTGNLCRCTGYAPIIKAALDVKADKHVSVKKCHPYKSIGFDMEKPIRIVLDELEFFAPTTIEEACTYKQKNNDVIIFSGSTDLGVQINKGKLQPKKIMSLHLIPELYQQEVIGNEVNVGARVTLHEVQRLISDKIKSFDHFLNIFASPQIKNMATLIGNVANASPIADTTPVLMALDAIVDVSGVKGERSIELKNFYTGYKKLNLTADEIITRIRFYIPEKNSVVKNYKVSQRRDLDISTVNASFYLSLNQDIIAEARIAVGGVAATTIRLFDVEKYLQGKKFNESLIDEVKIKIFDNIQPLSDVRGSAEYRKILTANLFEKFVHEGFST